MKNLGKGIGGALLSLAFVFGIFTATSGIAQAQDRNDDGNYQRGQQDGDRQDQNRNLRRRRNRNDRSSNNQGDWRRNQDQNRNNGVYGN
ncbi:MAG TPA: hypothetical protein DHU55_02235, partial [Blastocatellia bacterium]|nr:hypothetical protein [Blastocatellia bacterium]HCX28583.1 hypothetical protein [Blastocatellia bacterium]